MDSTREGRSRRLTDLAAEWGVATLPPPPVPAQPLRRPSLPIHVSQKDDQVAESLLQRQREESGSGKDSHGGIRRVFNTSKKKGWEPLEISKALDAHVATSGDAGVAEALVAKLVAAGGDPNIKASKTRTSLILSRKKSLETLERSRVLQKAVETGNAGLVGVLARFSDSPALDHALPTAVRSGELVVVELLLQYGAKAAATADGQDAFRQACAAGGQPGIVGLILQSEGRPSASWISRSMEDAARRGCLETVLRLSRSIADGNYNDGMALRLAISLCRVDMALAILTGTEPPRGKALDLAFAELFQHKTIAPKEKLALAEGLLCAGASGDVVSEGLLHAASTQFYDMVDLLLSYGASLEYNEAHALRDAISQRQNSLVRLLLSKHPTMSMANASRCVRELPQDAAPADRFETLHKLLCIGAAGEPLNDALLDAVEAGDVASVKLLLALQTPEEKAKLRCSPRCRGHDFASVDHRAGLALQIAVSAGDLAMVDTLLSAKHSSETLDAVFLQLQRLPLNIRNVMIERFLAAGLTGSCISGALLAAVEETPRDDRLIGLLLSYNADVNFNGGEAVLSAIARQDCSLLRLLLKKQPRPDVAAAGLCKALELGDGAIRYDFVKMLLHAGASRDSDQITGATVGVLQLKPVDVRLLKLLLNSGCVDTNSSQGLVVVQAALDDDPAVLDVILQKGTSSPVALDQALLALIDMPTNQAKATKVASILRSCAQPASLNRLLVQEVQALLRLPPDQRSLTVLRLLLQSGSNVNAQKAAALRLAVSAVSISITDALLSADPRPSSMSLAASLPHSLKISDPVDRLTFTKKLIDAGAPGKEANRALVHAIRKFSDDLPLIQVLASRAEMADGEAMSWAVRLENPEILEVLFAGASNRYVGSILDCGVEDALKVKSKEKRLGICEMLLRVGASRSVASKALLTAAADGDLPLVQLLLSHGASVEHRDGLAIIEACRSGSVEVLRLLLSKKPDVNKSILDKGFQAATDVGDLENRAHILRLLLQNGVVGEIVDEQLISAARYGDQGVSLVKLLLEFGADVNYHDGEAIWTATRSAFMTSLALMIGIDPIGKQQRKPSRATITKALKASWRLSRDLRYQAIQWILTIESATPEAALHLALNKAVKDEPDVRLVKLLMSKGASPTANGCQTLVDAAQNLLVDELEFLLEADISVEDLSWTFQQVFSALAADSWFSDRGYEVAKRLIAKGARGEGLSTALAVSMDMGSGLDSARKELARNFVELLVPFADVDHDDGLVLQRAVKLADPGIVELVLSRTPNTNSISTAFPLIFDSTDEEQPALRLINILAEYRNEGHGLDVMFMQSDSVPVLLRAISAFPRSPKVLEALLDAGYFLDQKSLALIHPETEEGEQVNLLMWALLQPQKRVSDSVIELLISRGGNVNFETRITKTTPLMLAVSSKRKEIV
ncbi:hypothetical protein VTK73DRAFT_6504 [Phialemonium thermophilum]|uniref:Uncharacterized protein n=1 Tax=Phialemonium thermophilum TaxID=223376 RepID=A0ABR3WJK2_9PEZI